MNISLTRHNEEFIEKQLDSGHYANRSEVVRAALRMMEQNTDVEARIQAGINRGLADIEAGRVSDFDPEEIIAEGRKRLADRKSK